MRMTMTITINNAAIRFFCYQLGISRTWSFFLDRRDSLHKLVLREISTQSYLFGKRPSCNRLQQIPRLFINAPRPIARWRPGHVRNRLGVQPFSWPSFAAAAVAGQTCAEHAIRNATSASGWNIPPTHLSSKAGSGQKIRLQRTQIGRNK
jgi:hypothetical protein